LIIFSNPKRPDYVIDNHLDTEVTFNQCENFKNTVKPKTKKVLAPCPCSTSNLEIGVEKYEIKNFRYNMN